MDAGEALEFMDDIVLPALVPQPEHREGIMDAMGPVELEPPPLLFTDRIPARVAVLLDVQVARLITEHDIEEMRANRVVARNNARVLHMHGLFDSGMAEEAMRKERELGVVDDDARQSIMAVKNERKRLRKYWAFLEQCVDKNNLPVDVVCVV